jgi:cytochrome c peroxidase
MDGSRPTPYLLDLPETFPAMEIPADNPMTVEGVELGRRLFFDPILSVDSTVACASCHAPAAAFTDPAAFSAGVAGRTDRNSMPLINAGWMESLFWDGRAVSLEDQALQPVEDTVEMGERWENVVVKLKRHPAYPGLFEAAFETRDITADLTVKAIAQFERTLVSHGSKYDRYRAGEVAFTPQEELGYNLFFTEQADCFHCHGTALFTDNRFHNNGLDVLPADSGLAAVTGQAFDIGKFKAPTLRNVEFTAPYMHDGRFETLEEVVDFYNDAVQPSPTLDPLLGAGSTRQMNLNDEEKAALIAFHKTLSDPEFVRPRNGP